MRRADRNYHSRQIKSFDLGSQNHPETQQIGKMYQEYDYIAKNDDDFFSKQKYEKNSHLQSTSTMDESGVLNQSLNLEQEIQLANATLEGFTKRKKAILKGQNKHKKMPDYGYDIKNPKNEVHRPIVKNIATIESNDEGLQTVDYSFKTPQVDIKNLISQNLGLDRSFKKSKTQKNLKVPSDPLFKEETWIYKQSKRDLNDSIVYSKKEQSQKSLSTFPTQPDFNYKHNDFLGMKKHPVDFSLKNLKIEDKKSKASLKKKTKKHLRNIQDIIESKNVHLYLF